MIRRHLILLCFGVVLGACSDEKTREPEAGKNPSTSPGLETPAPSLSARKDAPADMVYIPGGSYQRGGDLGEEGGNSVSHEAAYPIHEVHVDAFWIDATEVTNRQFLAFVEATGYKTFAERPLPEASAAELKEETRRNLARLELLAANASGEERDELLASMERLREAAPQPDRPAGSMIFAIPAGKLAKSDDLAQWWKVVPEANWRTPGGPGTSLDGLLDHPVVNVNLDDAAAFAKWAGKRLPTEAEWEKAARGGLDRQRYAWGKGMFPQGEAVWMANIWQGEFPLQNTKADGFFTTAPVKSFPPNAFGLYDVAGNVWEIVADLYHPEAYLFPSATAPNSSGPSREEAQQPVGEVSAYVTKGGSFLCSDMWCKGYQPGSRDWIDNESPSNHTGFRCARGLGDLPE